MSEKREIRDTLKSQMVSLQKGTARKKQKNQKVEAETVQHADETKIYICESSSCCELLNVLQHLTYTYVFQLLWDVKCIGAPNIHLRIPAAVRC